MKPTILFLLLSLLLGACSKDVEGDPYNELVTYDNWYRIGDNDLSKEFIRFARTDFISNSGYLGNDTKTRVYNYTITEKGRIKFYEKNIEKPDTLYTDYSVTNGILKIFNGRTYERGK